MTTFLERTTSIEQPIAHLEPAGSSPSPAPSPMLMQLELHYWLWEMLALEISAVYAWLSELHWKGRTYALTRGVSCLNFKWMYRQTATSIGWSWAELSQLRQDIAEARCGDSFEQISPGSRWLLLGVYGWGSLVIHSVIALLIIFVWRSPDITEPEPDEEFIPVEMMELPEVKASPPSPPQPVAQRPEPPRPEPPRPEPLPPEPLPPPEPPPPEPLPRPEPPPPEPVVQNSVPIEPPPPPVEPVSEPAPEPEPVPTPLPTPVPRMTPLIEQYRNRAEPEPAPAPPDPKPIAQPSPPPEPPPDPGPPDVLAGPVPGSQTPPDYPERARRDNKEGQVGLSIQIDEGGLVADVRVVSSSGNDELDDAAIEAVKRWDFTPARRGAKPISSWVSVNITFQLE